MQRDLYIDFAKGLATLSVIFIHTAFWSGQFYVTTEVRVFSLLFDVVLFYALSGITSGGNLEKNILPSFETANHLHDFRNLRFLC